MAKLPELIPVTDFRQGAADILKRVQSNDDAVVITQRGRAAAVMMSLEVYERVEREKQLLHLLAQGEKELQNGEGFDIDEVFVDADKLLNQE